MNTGARTSSRLPPVGVAIVSVVTASDLSWNNKVGVACPATRWATKETVARLDPKGVDIDPTLPLAANIYHLLCKGFLPTYETADGVAGVRP